jgi:hypothetical protein
LFDLRVLTSIASINDDLRMTPEMAIRVSPALMKPPTDAQLHIAVGGQEIGGFKDQHRIIAQSWPGNIGADIPCPEDNHFSILERFADGQSGLFRASMSMMGL